MIRNPVKAAMHLCIPATPRQLALIAAQRDKIIAEHSSIQKKWDKLLPIERAIVPELKEKVQQAKSLDKLGKYPLFKLDCLKWRNKSGAPLLAIFNLESPVFKISVVGRRNRRWGAIRWHKNISPSLPTALQECYSDVLDRLSLLARKAPKARRVVQANVSLETKFNGLIPDDVRQKIVECKKEFKQIFIVAEATKYDLKEKVVTAPKQKFNPDPLVIGHDGTNFWLIAAFDMTPLEEYLKITLR
jgi:hypothetical protein